VNRARFEQQIESRLGSGRLLRDAPLADLTTFRVGGPADWLLDVRSVPELEIVLAAAREAEIPVTVLGGGSNIVVADAGVRGVVIRLRLMGIEQVRPGHVRAEGGATINGLVRWTVSHGLAGLEAWAGTPGTVGGAIFGNAHYAGRNIGDLVTRLELATTDGALQTVSPSEMEFAYDTSRLRRTREILVWAEFGVAPGVTDDLRRRARESLAYRKRTQPLAMPSAGCVFQNPDPQVDALPEGVPASAGALVDRAGLKGHRIGAARISPTHANFVVNEGGATARDIRAVVEAARSAVRAKFGIELKDEVVYLGEF
jgi:UDP-N-acetylmuramate dehydrogenase